jgi:nicotinamidase-related amidase
MRVCQFRHFGTGHWPGRESPAGSNFESRKWRNQCQRWRPDVGGSVRIPIDFPLRALGPFARLRGCPGWPYSRCMNEKPALIVIDVQRAFDEWEAAGQRRNNPDAVARIAELLAAFRAAGAPIFHIRHEGIEPGSSFLRGSPGYQVKDEAREREGEPVIVKRVNSAFIGTDLESRLRSAGIGTVVICGATTNHCVETTTRMAGNLGFEAWLVRDAVWTFDRVGPDGDRHSAEEIHAMTLANLNDEFARIVTAREAIAALEAEGRTR